MKEKEIVRQTIVYSDGSMIILVKDGDVFRIERRNHRGKV